MLIRNNIIAAPANPPSTRSIRSPWTSVHFCLKPLEERSPSCHKKLMRLNQQCEQGKEQKPNSSHDHPNPLGYQILMKIQWKNMEKVHHPIQGWHATVPISLMRSTKSLTGNRPALNASIWEGTCSPHPTRSKKIHIYVIIYPYINYVMNHI